MLIKQIVEEADGLDGLTQTHLICKNATVASVNDNRKQRGTGKLRVLDTLGKKTYIYININIVKYTG